MEPPRRLLDRILEICVVLALSAFLLRLAVYFLLDVWKYLLVIVIIVIVGIIGWRVYKYFRDLGKW